MNAPFVEQVPVLTDNYVYLVHAGEGTVGIVDPPEAAFLAALTAARRWNPRFEILSTHHHADHTGGNRELHARYGAKATGPRADAARIPCIETQVGDGDLVQLGPLTAQVFDVPGHTRGHIAYYFPALAALFCGDTLFSLDCGRLFGGTPAQMFASLAKFKTLPPETLVYCAHEYTAANYRFAAAVDPDNAALKARGAEVRALRATCIYHSSEERCFCGEDER